MYVRTAKAIGAAVRQRRRELGLDQQTFAKRIGANRKWVIAVEQGKDSAEVGRVLRAIEALGMSVELVDAKKTSRKSSRKQLRIPVIDIDAIVDGTRGKKPV